MSDSIKAENHFDVVVVGAGLVGATAALALHNIGLKVGLVDPALNVAVHAPASSDSGGNTYPSINDLLQAYDCRVSALSGSTRALLETLGVWPEASTFAQPFGSMHVWDDRNSGSIRFDAADIQAKDLGCIVENSIVLAALRKRLAKAAETGNLHLLAGKMKSLSQAVDGRREIVVQPEAAAGESAVPLTLSASLLVAADGPGSMGRRLLDIPTREWDYGQQAIVATIAFAKPHGGVARQNFMPDGPLALLPLKTRAGVDAGPEGSHLQGPHPRGLLPQGPHSQGLISIVWSQNTAAAKSLMAADDAQFLEALTTASCGELGEAIAVGPRLSVPLRQLHARTYIASSAALLGDAAHVIHPLAGRGVNLGMKDVAALLQAIERGQRRGLSAGHPEVLRAYELARKPENLAVMAIMEGFHRGFTARSGVLNSILNTGMSAFDSLFPLKRRIMRLALD